VTQGTGGTRRRKAAQAAPVVSLTSDFGLQDWYVAAMKAAVLTRCPGAQLVDITHRVPQGDVQSAGICLQQAISSFPAQSVHLAVVDPGVGSARRLLIARIRGQLVVCPDNGLVTWAWRRHGGQCWELTWRPPNASSTFHGRDIMGPVAGMLAAGADVSRLGRKLDNPVLLELAPAEPATGRIIYIDHFGNAITNVPAEAVAEHDGEYWMNGRYLGSLRRTYSDVATGKALILVGSSGLLEVAVRDGSAARRLGLEVGMPLVYREDGRKP